MTHNPNQLQQRHELPPEVKIGGDRIGGELSLLTDVALDGYTRNDGFLLGDVPADLIAIVAVGHKNGRMGIVKAELGGDVESESDLLFVKLDESPDGKFEIATDINGSPAARKLLKGNTPLTYGRVRNSTSSELLDLEQRGSTGVLQDRGTETISKSHLVIGYNGDGSVLIRDNQSFNGTQIVGNIDKGHNVVNAKWRTQESIGGVAVGAELTPVSDDDLIDKVPSSDEEARGMLRSKDAEQKGARIAEIDARILELEAQYDELNLPFDKEERQLLWEYSSGIMNKADAQKRGDGNSSTIYGQQSGSALMKLSVAGRSVKHEHLHIMQELQKARNSYPE